MKNNEFDEFDILNNDDKLSFSNEDDVDLDDLISLMVAHNFAQIHEQQAEEHYGKISIVSFAIILISSFAFIGKASGEAGQFPVSMYLIILAESVSSIAVLPLLFSRLANNLPLRIVQERISISLNWIHGVCYGALPLCVGTALFTPVCVDKEYEFLFCKIALVLGISLILNLIVFTQGKTVRKLLLKDIYLIFALLAIPAIKIIFA